MAVRPAVDGPPPDLDHLFAAPTGRREKGTTMDLHPLHKVYLGIGGEGSPTIASRDLHPLHRLSLGIDPGPAATLPAGARAGKKAGPNGVVRAAAGLVAAMVVARVAAKPFGGR